MLNPITFIRELRRRRVFRVAVIYGVGAWGVIAGCDVIFPQLTQWVADPDRAMRVVFIAALVNFPVALVFGWLYDITGEGLQRTASFSETAHDPDTSLHRVDFGIIGSLSLLLLAVIIATAVHIVRIPAAAPIASTVVPEVEIPENSIAVLPFYVCEGEDIDQLLATGIASEVLRHLAQLPGIKVTAKFLKVIARASAFAFAEADVEPQRIAATLRVHYLLSATVCRDGDTLNITAELVDEDGYLVWTESFTEQVDAAGQVTRTLAASVAKGVAVRLGAIAPVPEDKPVNRLAYEKLLIGREYRYSGEKEKARAAIEASLELQPDYAEAIYELATLDLPGNAGMKSLAYLVEAKPLMERALAIARREVEDNPRSAKAHFIVGRITKGLAYTQRNLAWRNQQVPDFEALQAALTEAERHLRKSLELDPSDENTYGHLADALESQGRFAEELSILEQALERDPLNLGFISVVAKRWSLRGRYREAMDLLGRFRELPDMQPGALAMMSELARLNEHLDENCEILIETLTRHPSALDLAWMRFHVWLLSGHMHALGLEQEAAEWKSRLEALSMPDWLRTIVEPEMDRLLRERAAEMSDEEVLDVFGELGLYLMRAEANGGEYDRPIRVVESIVHAPPMWRERAPFAPVLLAQLYLQVGRNDEADELLAQTAEELEANVHAGERSGETLGHLAAAYAMRGQIDPALSMLEMSAEHGYWGISCLAWRVDEESESGLDHPFLELEDAPRFKVLVQQCEKEKQRQATRIRAMLAEYDLDELLAPLIEYESII